MMAIYAAINGRSIGRSSPQPKWSKILRKGSTIGSVISVIGTLISGIGSVISVLGSVVGFLGGPLTIGIGAIIALVMVILGKTHIFRRKRWNCEFV